jgi:chemotaxis methyl-accepting protein methylase
MTLPADDPHEKYGDVFVTRVLTGQSYFIRDPEVVNAINDRAKRELLQQPVGVPARPLDA